MQCSCGEETRPAKNIFNKSAVELRYSKCPECGRIGGQSLLVGGEFVMSGNEAHKRYLELESEYNAA